MVLLAIDTAGPACSAAIVRASGDRRTEPLSIATETMDRGHAERLMPMIEAVIGEAGVAFADIDRIAVTTGPGSFTGVRIGVAAARGLALALDIPALGIGSLDALGRPAALARTGGTLVAVLDAKRGELYAMAKDLGSGATIVEPMCVRAKLLAERLASAGRPLVLTGAGAPILADAIGDDVEIAGVAAFPDIVDVAELGLAAAAGGPPVPLYLRRADAKPQADKALARR